MASRTASIEGFTLNPFHAIVRAKVIRSFRALGAGDPEPALALMADDVRYTFEGEHALGGTRTRREAVRRWFGRLLRLLPGRFALRSVRVSGWPWRARVVTLFEDTVAPAHGRPYVNRGVQIAEVAWGKAKRIETFVDTAKVAHALSVLAESGVAEASAEPITA